MEMKYKKSIMGRLCTAITITVLALMSGCGSKEAAESGTAETYTYESGMGYSIELPNCYKESVTIVPGENHEEFYVKEIYEDGGHGRLFTVMAVESGEAESAMSIMENSTALGITSDSRFTYIAGTPTDVQFEEDDRKQYEMLFGYYESIIGTFTMHEPEEISLASGNGVNEKGEYIFPESHSRYLDESELTNLTEWECNVARNEIYARHGRKFDSERLQEYFNGCSWYNPTFPPDEFSESVLNEYELANIDMIVDYETVKGYRKPEAVYVGDVMDYMISDVIDQTIKVDGIAVFASMGLDGTPGKTISVSLADENRNSSIILEGIYDKDIEDWGLQDGDYCSVTGYVYYGEYDTLMIDVMDIDVW